MKVKNINGTAGLACGCGSWLKHWQKFSKKTPFYCSEKSCLQTQNLVGAHVQKAASIDSYWYIVPLCTGHNQAKGELDITDDTPLIAANRQSTCG